MEGKREYLTITDGTYILSETDCPNEFAFYRKDGEILGDVGRIPMEMYDWRMFKRMQDYNIVEPIIESIIFERSRDDRCLMMTVMWYDLCPENQVNQVEEVEKKKKNSKVYEFFKKYFC